MTDQLRGWGRTAATFLLVTLVFALAYGQAPLYYSNQNQYFLHGLAQAGHGHLENDWLAGTTDPTPIFSKLVAMTYRWLPEGAYHVYYALVMGVYLVSLLNLFEWLAGGRADWRLRLAFLALMLLVHDAVVRWASYRWLGQDFPWYLQAGVAGQYVLGAMFQPSVFGVLLIASLALFVRDRPGLAVTVAVLAGILHSTYLLGAGMLTLGYMVAMYREGRGRLAVGLGILAGVLALPVLVYMFLEFRPSSMEALTESQAILVHQRIPHHSLPHLWCDPVASAQILWAILGIGLLFRTRLFLVLAIVFGLSAALTVLQIATGSDALALLFPWRTSAFLVPVATAVILGRLVLLARPWMETTAAAVISAVVILTLAAAGAWIMTARLGYQTTDEELAVMDWVRDHKQPGDLFLLPVQVPKLAVTTRGSLSSDFKPLIQKRTDKRIIPVDLQRFRLYTGAPIYVDFKSVPYRDLDVLEWRSRLQSNQEVIERLRDGDSEGIADLLKKLQVTHVVVPRSLGHTSSAFEVVYEDPHYRVLRLPQQR